MPGYAGADKPRDFDYTVEGYARHLAGLLEPLEIRRVHLVMHDFGGPWGLAWAAAHGDQVASVTLINIGVLIDYRWHRYARIARTPVLGEIFTYTATRRGFRWLAARDNPQLPGEWLDGLYDYARPSATRRAVLRLYRATPPDVTEPYAQALRALDPPTLVIWGTADAYVPREQAERQRETFPSARIELLEGAGHWSFLEQPERVASLVVAFLTERLGRDDRPPTIAQPT